MKVSEIFCSISGEGIHVGIPTVFVRLTGCNLRCTYCDTKYAFDGGEEKSLDNIMYEVVAKALPFQKRWVLITGGEPLLQNIYPLVRRLKDNGYLVEIETNGSIAPPRWYLDNVALIDSWNVDVKCPCSGPAYGSFQPGWLSRLRGKDQLKFVVGKWTDLDFAQEFLREHRCRAVKLVSPILSVGMDDFSTTHWPEITYNVWWLRRCAEFCKEQNVRMSLQLHKIIWGDKRGV